MIPGARRINVRRQDTELDIYVLGPDEPRGEPVAMLASLGRGASDFAHLAGHLAGIGRRVIVPEPRGIGASAGPMSGLTLHSLAEDVIATVDETCAGPVIMLGHAFGNRLARTVAADAPDKVAHLVLLACGGKVEMPRASGEVLRGCFDESLNREEHLECVRQGFFAEGNSPEVWSGGWFPLVAAMQSEAVRATPLEDWWEAGGQPMLVVQALEDVIALPANASDLKARFGDRVTLVELPHAGHAMLPEQPDEIARIVSAYLSGERDLSKR